MPHAIETHGLTKVFRTRFRRREVRAVDGISLTVPESTVFGLLGPNGAGKTTFVKMLLSATHPTSGQARVYGLDARAPEARRPVGYLPENHRFPTYFTGTGMLDFYAALSGVSGSERKRLIPELLERVGLKGWGDMRIRKYSKGMLQRLGLAQAIIHKPRLLILDEPTDGVDPVGRREIRDLLYELKARGVTIFLNSHLLAEVEQFCEEVAIIHKGKVALQGAVKDLTIGKGYRLKVSDVPERLRTELAANASLVSGVNGTVEFLFASRELVNQSIDKLRAERCEIEAIIPSASTLEDIFIQTVRPS